MAPVAGTVQNVKVHTPGAVVSAADVLMTVVPDGAGIEIDAAVDNKDIGFVREGQEVAIKIDAFPFTRYGPWIWFRYGAFWGGFSSCSFEKADSNGAYGIPLANDKNIRLGHASYFQSNPCAFTQEFTDLADGVAYG